MYVPPDRFNLSSIEQARLDTFRDWVWFNSELCNNCFSQVRAIGDEMVVRKSSLTYRTNEFYERTTEGSREHPPSIPPTKRFGMTMCNNCGSDLTAEDENCIPTERFKEYAVRLHDYIDRQTPLELDEDTFAYEAIRLKKKPELQNCGRKILAVAFVRALERDGPRPTSDASDDQLRADGGR